MKRGRWILLAVFIAIAGLAFHAATNWRRPPFAFLSGRSPASSVTWQRMWTNTSYEWRGDWRQVSKAADPELKAKGFEKWVRKPFGEAWGGAGAVTITMGRLDEDVSRATPGWVSVKVVGYELHWWQRLKRALRF